MWLLDFFSSCWHTVSGWFIYLWKYISPILHFLNEYKLLLVIISVSSILLSIIGCIALITFLPSDYFTESKHGKHINNLFLRIVVSITKNLIGVILVIMGILLSVPGIPGQGLLTIFAGIILSDFPGKKRFARKIIKIKAVNSSANQIRNTFNRSPLILDE
ncbi:hypothetical protein C6497_02670 [Candidatus Poribacteria bacterium]|nr:MAG: hypothetical protein C6497_02670 [Candidatus Poribacteria bacterium]